MKKLNYEKMNDPYRKMPTGTKETVDGVDDIGTIHVSWDNGYHLGVAYGEDSCRVLTEHESEKDK